MVPLEEFLNQSYVTCKSVQFNNSMYTVIAEGTIYSDDFQLISDSQGKLFFFAKGGDTTPISKNSVLFEKYSNTNLLMRDMINYVQSVVQSNKRKYL